MSKANGFLDTQKTEPMPDLARCMVIAKKEYGKSLFSQISEMAKLAFSPRKIQPAEYYYFRLYDDDRFSFSDKRAFVGIAADTARAYLVKSRLSSALDAAGLADAELRLSK